MNRGLAAVLALLPALALAPGSVEAAATAAPTAAPTATPPVPTCDTPRAAPDPDRPRMTLTFDVATDHRSVVGHELISFTPDLPIDELVFRLAANGKETVDGGNGITVTSAVADHGGGTPTYKPANAASGTQGGLLRIPLAQQVPAGTTVTAPASDTVLMSGHPRVGSKTGAQNPALVQETARAITRLAERFGPYPFPTLSIALIPARGGGIEYPSSIFLWGPDRYLVVHEVAHQWFYAMVGNSQALHPWLDEAFATYAEEITDGVPDHPEDLQRPRPVDSTVEAFGDHVYPFYYTIYAKGSEALRTARDRAGADAFDAASALRGLPAALQVLREAGALP